MAKRPILNTHTRVSAEKTISEIQKLLAEHGANAVMTEYDENQVVSAVSFRLPHPAGPISFRLPARIDPIYVLLQHEGDRKSHRTREHASSVAWRIVKTWIEAQLAMIQAEQVEMVEVFLPFAQDPTTGKTAYELLSKDGFALLTGPKQ